MPSSARRAVVLAVAGVLLVFAPPAGAVGPVQLAGSIDDAAVAADGSLRLITNDVAKGDRVGISLVQVDPLGAALVPLRLRKPAPWTAGARAAFTPTGTVIAYTTQGKHPTVRVYDRAISGARTRPMMISEQSHQAQLLTLVAGTGATAITFNQKLGGGLWQAMVAYRPRGATKFRPAVETAAPTRRPDEKAPSRVLLAANGLAALFDSTENGDTIRRLNTKGELGPKIAIKHPDPNGRSADAVIQPDGTVVIATTTTTDSTNTNFASDLYISTVPPRRGPATKPLRVAHRTIPDNTGDSLQIKLGAGDHVVIASGGADQGPTFYEGPPTQLTPVLSKAAPYGTDFAVATDGTIVAAWSDGYDTDAQKLMVAHRPPGGQFSTPHAIVAGNVLPGRVIPLPSDQVAIYYYNPATKTELLTRFALSD